MPGSKPRGPRVCLFWLQGPGGRCHARSSYPASIAHLTVCTRDSQRASHVTLPQGTRAGGRAGPPQPLELPGAGTRRPNTLLPRGSAEGPQGLGRRWEHGPEGWRGAPSGQRAGEPGSAHSTGLGGRRGGGRDPRKTAQPLRGLRQGETFNHTSAVTEAASGRAPGRGFLTRKGDRLPQGRPGSRRPEGSCERMTGAAERAHAWGGRGPTRQPPP